MLAALGAVFLDKAKRPITGIAGGSLGQIRSIDTSRLTDLSHIDIVIASDVQNPLTGPNGAAAVYGPQKGATPAIVHTLDTGLIHLVHYLNQAGYPDAERHANTPGAGAAGGLGFAGLLLGGRTVSGADYFLDLLDFETHLQGCDLVITGEGRMDNQTLNGKLPAIIAQPRRNNPGDRRRRPQRHHPRRPETNGHRSRARHRRPHRPQPGRRPRPDQAAPRAARPHHRTTASPKHPRSDSRRDHRHRLTTIRSLTRSRPVDTITRRTPWTPGN